MTKVWLRKKTMDLCAREIEEHEHGVGAGVNTSLFRYSIVNSHKIVDIKKL